MSTELEPRFCDSSGWSEEFDCVPLRLRLKMLRANVSKQDDHVEAIAGVVGTNADNALMCEEDFGDRKEDRDNKDELKHETGYCFDDGLEDIVLGERRRMLISRQLTQPCGSYMLEQVQLEEMSNSLKAAIQTAETEKQKLDSIQSTLIADNMNTLSSAHDYKSGCDVTSNGKSLPLLAELRASSTLERCKSFSIQENNITNANAIAKVKDEPVDTIDVCSEGKSGMQAFVSGSGILAIKSEPASFDSLGDELDHLPLTDRVKLLSSGTSKPSMDTLDSHEFSKDSFDSSSDFDVQPVSISRPLKRKRTATDSVETALEEDVPGLLKVLIERGVPVDQMKLYGEEGCDGDLDDTPSEDGFGELEAVLSQLCSQRQTFIKFPLLRTKGAKISYCLACLLSLAEQTRYLRNRNWPVEWGWCRDLQSFIFVFQRHNRIVLERPEYGYATYFFELLDSIPAAWQIKRLVTAMKLTNCGRITLIENKPLMVGDDLSEGEARVLAEYGWTPNTGLGTMLNYCDRVIHDRRQEMHSKEWRSKIVKQLMNGYNGGNIVCKSLPKKLTEYQSFEEDADVQVKLEEEWAL